MGFALLRLLKSEYQIRFYGISTLLVVRLYYDLVEKRVEFSQSHFISTPLQDGPYIPSEPWAEDLCSAAQKAVFDLKRRYEEAVKEGHTPEESWLVVNEDFDSPCDHRTLLKRPSDQPVCTMKNCSIIEV